MKIKIINLLYFDMNKNLLDKCAIADLQKLFKDKAYAFFTKGDYNLNIIGVRSAQNNIVTNKYDDILIVDYCDDKKHRRYCYEYTTDPGTTWMRKPMNKKGTAILVPGQYRSTYSLALHNGKYKALCQNLKPVKVYRDNNRDEIYDLIPSTIEQGFYGINIHRASQNWDVEKVNDYSAGCQVVRNNKDYSFFIKLCEKAAKIYGNKFTYTLIEEEDLNGCL